MNKRNRSSDQDMLRSDIIPTTILNVGDIDCKNHYTSVTTLEERRKETQAIRQLWLNLQSRKHRLRNLETTSSRVSSSREPRNSISNVFPSIPVRFTESAPPAPGSRRISNSNHGEIPYHTAITMPPGKKQTLTKFNALNRKLIFRLPNVYDYPVGLPAYSTRDVKEWRNEVTKIVPKRPPIYTPTSSIPRDMSEILPPETLAMNDTLCMFHPVSPRYKGKGKDYVVNPEWPSEGVTPRSVRDRAHCVYVWPI